MTAAVEQTKPRSGGYSTAAAIPVVCIGIIVTAVLLLVLGIIGLIVGVVLTAVATVVRVRTFATGIESQILAGLPLRDADGDDAAGLRNLADGLAATAGVPIPRLAVIDDPSCNALVVGTSPEDSVLVVTSGLLASTTRVELESVVARALVQIRQGDLVDATMAVRFERTPVTRAVASITGALRSAEDPDRDVLLDRAAVGLTRYPPGLIGALEACLRTGTGISVATAPTAHLWMVDPTGTDVTDELNHRIEALRLL